MITRWDSHCDKALHRLMCYIHTHPDRVTRSIVGDDLHDCRMVLFCDADFAGDKSACKSTTGVHHAIIGPSTFIPVATISRKQGAVSLSTCESEIVAMVTGLKEEALPLLDLWEAIPSDKKLSSELIILKIVNPRSWLPKRDTLSNCVILPEPTE